jgi:hypothetical protein
MLKKSAYLVALVFAFLVLLSGCANFKDYNRGEPKPAWYNDNNICPFHEPFIKHCGEIAVWKRKNYRIVDIHWKHYTGAYSVIMEHSNGDRITITRKPIE